MIYSMLWMYQMSGIFHRNIGLMLVANAVIRIMASLNAQSLLTWNGLTRLRPSSPRAEAVVVAEVDAMAEAALQDGAVGIMTKPIPVAGGRAMMLRCLQHLPWMLAQENTRESGAWFANPAGGIPPIPLDFTTNGMLVLHPFPATHLFWLKSGKKHPEGGVGGPVAPNAATQTTTASIASSSLLSLRVGPLIALYKTNVEDGQFASNFADFERALN